jgi:hypothetical protein
MYDPCPSPLATALIIPFIFLEHFWCRYDRLVMGRVNSYKPITNSSNLFVNDLALVVSTNLSNCQNFCACNKATNICYKQLEGCASDQNMGFYTIMPYCQGKLKLLAPPMYCVLRYLAAVMIHQTATINLNLKLGLLR